MTPAELTAQICAFLKIKPPKVEVVNDLPGTMFAATDRTKRTVYIRENYKDRRDLAFSLAHECRHLWQRENKQAMLTQYAERAEQPSLRDYNLQPAELDANAFAAAYMMAVYGLKPLFGNLDADIRETIYSKAVTMQKYF